MVQEFYEGINTYVVYAEDSAFGTAGTPTGGDYVDKVTSFTGNIVNNMIRVQGIGDGRNATHAVNGVLDCNGNIAFQLTDPAFLQYCFIGILSGAGTVGDPYEITESDDIGYGSGQVNTLTLEVGSVSGSNDDIMTYDGVVVNNFTLTANQGEVVNCTADWIGRTATSSTSAVTYAGPSNRPFTFVDGSVTAGTDTVAKVTSFSLTIANNIFTYRSLGSRLINQPVAGIRRYDFTMTIRKQYDDTASVLSGLEARSLVFAGTSVATTPLDAGENASLALSFDLVEGAASGDRVVNIDFENAYFESWNEPVVIEEGVIEQTIAGFALSGLTDTGVKVPVRWWTI